jgi:ATP-dependent RNA helicase DDX3X
MSGYLHTLRYFFGLPFNIAWRTALVQIPRFVPLSILHITSPKGPHPFLVNLPSRNGAVITLYVFVPPAPVDLEGNEDRRRAETGEWRVPVVLDFHGGGFIMGSPLEQAPYASMMSRELGAVVISVSYRIGPFHQFPAAIHDAEDALSAILDLDGITDAGKYLRTEIQRYYTIMRTNTLSRNKKKKKKKEPLPSHIEHVTTITLDPERLCISGFSAGGNIALNMAVSAPPCADLLQTDTGRSNSISRGPSLAATMSPLLPRNRAPTILDNPLQPWPTILPPPQARPRFMPLLLFYPSLDARLLPHERPMKTLPNALKGDDKAPDKPRMPGLFSIMGPTYLPQKLRPHPRASPGLIDPENIQKNAAMFLVLPEKDTLAVQSDVWVDKMNCSGWHGHVRFGDGREHDWDGIDGGAPYPKVDTNGGLEVWHAPNCRHGWTQFPDIAVGKHERKERKLVFERTLQFVKDAWRRELPIPDRELGNNNQELRPLRIPTQFGGLQN